MDRDDFKRAVERTESQSIDIIEASDADRDSRIEELEKKVVSLDNRLRMLESRVALGFLITNDYRGGDILC